MAEYSTRYFRISLSLLIAVVLLCLYSLSGALAQDNLTPTPIPLPDRPESTEQLQALMLEVDTCQLPCFWGFQPGHTSADDVISFVQLDGNFNTLREKYSINYDFAQDDEEIPPLIITFSIEADLLTEIELIIDRPAEWLPTETLELSHLLTTMPSTPEIYLAVNTGQRRIFLTLVYDEEGVLAQYPFPLRVQGNVMSPSVDEPILLCTSPRLNDFIEFWLQDGNGRELLEEHYYGFAPDASNNPNWPVEQMTAMDTAEFVRQVIANPNGCIEMLSYPDLLEQGYEF